jgi:hypothetical protein
LSSPPKIFLRALAAAALLTAVARAAETAPAAGPPWPLPPIRGNAAGTLTTPGLPDVRWEMTTAAPATAGRQRLLVEAQADGLKLAGEIELDPATRDSSWRLREATADAATWLPLLAEKLSLAWLKDFSASGTVRLSGAGPLRAGVPDGVLTVALRDATLTHAKAGLTLEGLATDFHLTGLDPPRTPDDQVVTFKEARVGGLTLRDGRIAFALPAWDTARVERAVVEVLGGSIETEPFTLSPQGPAGELRVRLREIDLEKLVAFLPKAGLAFAEGRVGGRMTLRWAPDIGRPAGEISLTGTRGAAAPIIRLSPAPGLLTAHMPERLVVLPRWLGPLGRWTAPRNPVFAPLQDIELGRAPLRIESLEILLRPKEDGGQLVRLRLVAQPAEPSLVPKVTLDVNVDGPVQELLRMSRQENLRLQTP